MEGVRDGIETLSKTLAFKQSELEKIKKVVSYLMQEQQKTLQAQ
jgi:uncharacterized coiled-coil protein SlyX